ncbi:hypothetical protein [Caballeronia sp. AZ10_KS36]|uniref:hypothetical protein n=1 Tax=Caballeronia sp. AZ10_KS36 TaxID=2921757 RepID=UPI002028D9A5|nr:hypothetical protein [Caballeronia sp. AZ10_KS36]
MEFPYYVINEETWQVAAGFHSVLDADAMVKRYSANGSCLRAVSADEVRKHHEDKYGVF